MHRDARGGDAGKCRRGKGDPQRQIAGVQHLPRRERRAQKCWPPRSSGVCRRAYLLKQMHDFQSGDARQRGHVVDGDRPHAVRDGARGGLFREKGLAGTDCPRRRDVGARRGGRMPGMPSAESGRRRWPAPRLAGQKYEYLVDAMRRYADGERKNNAEMMNIMKAISPADREAIARYISGTVIGRRGEWQRSNRRAARSRAMRVLTSAVDFTADCEVIWRSEMMRPIGESFGPKTKLK